MNEDMKANPTIIQSTIFVLNTLVHVLIDLDSTHSFMSHPLAKSLRVEIEPLGYVMWISTLMGKTIESSRTCKNCKVNESDVKFQEDLILLGMHNFDIIIEMDFLCKYDANVDC